MAEGNHQQHWIDGHKTVDVIDLDEKGRKLDGVLAVQVHVGPSMTIQYKDIADRTPTARCSSHRRLCRTKSEISKELGEYFEAGVRVVWLVDHLNQTVCVHTAINESILIKQGQTLDGGAVLTRVPVSDVPGDRNPLTQPHSV